MKHSIAFLAALISATAITVASVPAFAEESTDAATEQADVTASETSDEDSVETADVSEDSDTDTLDGVLEDGTYRAEFNTDSTMFHVNEANDGQGVLTVKDGEMTIHVSLVSKNIVNLFSGTTEDAQKEGAELLEPTTDTVTYSDGMSEEVYGFDIPVPALDEEFDVALIGKKGKWYDHKVSVSNPVPMEAEAKTLEELGLEDGTYVIDVTLSGDTDKAAVESPAELTVDGDTATAVITWDSPNYDFMLIDGEMYEPVNTDGNSAFEIPVTIFDAGITIVADAVEESTSHMIECELCFDSASITEAE